MSGPKRNPDKLNTIGVVVVGICGAVLVYVTIVALEAFYVNDTSEIQTMADYGGQDTNLKSLRAEQVNRIGEYGTNAKPAAPKANEAPRSQTYRMPVDLAMKLVVRDAKAALSDREQDPAASLVPAIGRSDKSTVLPIFGRPKLSPPPAPAAPSGTPAGTPAPAAPAPGDGSAAGAVVPAPAVPMTPTGTGTGPAPVPGAGALDKTPVPSPSPAPPVAPAVPAAPKAGSAAATPPKGNGK